MAGGSSPQTGEVDPQVDPVPPQTQDANPPADSSAADDQGAEKTTASVLDEVLSANKAGGEKSPDSVDGQDKTDPGAAEAKPDKDEKSEDGEGEEDLGEVTDEELKSYHSKTRRRVKQLLGRIDAYKEFGTPEEVKRYRESHEHYSSVVGFIEKAHLTGEDVNRGFEVMALMKNDPERAYPILKSLVERIEGHIGVQLPQDLADDVAQGRISEERARELSRARSQASFAAQRADSATREAETVQQRTQAERAAEAAGRAVSAWEARVSQSDPDWKAKSPRIQEKIELEVRRNGAPKSPDEAVKVAQDAYDAVTKEMKGLIGRNRAQINPPVTGGAATSAQPAPKTTAEAINFGLRQVAAR